MTYNSKLAQRVVCGTTSRSVDPDRDGVRAELAIQADQYFDAALQLAEEYGALPARGACPELRTATSRELALRDLVDHALQRQLRAENSDVRTGLSGTLRRWAREAAWFAAGLERGFHCGRELVDVHGKYDAGTNTVWVNADCEGFYLSAGQAGYVLAHTAAAQLRAMLVHESAHANFAAQAPALARVPGRQRSAALAAVLEGYATWVGNRVAARTYPDSTRLVDPAMHDWQLDRFGPERPDISPKSPLNSPYRQGAVWFELIHQLYGDAGILAVARLSEADLPRRAREWKDVAGWGDQMLGVPRGNDAPPGLAAPKHRLLSGRQPRAGRHRRT